MLRRGPGAKFMPNSLVFPGGVLDESDLRFPREKTDFADGEVCGKRSPICLGLDDDVALRVCAIRELFEEGGLLPVVEGDKPFLANAEGDVHLAEWRRKIMAEPESFAQLFHNRFRMSVSSLMPWSNWLTPLASRSGPRQETQIKSLQMFILTV
uniref:Nudix hydrolase domain-containing protein n=1 Tax=Globodera pallida TaxID=36090 RepID=A0A183BTL2_GLOPA